MRAISLYAIGVLTLVLLAACAVQPQTPAQRLAVVDAQFSAVVNAAADLRDQGILTPAQIDALDEPIQQGNRALTLAWQVLDDSPDEALDYVRIVNRLLLEIRAELQEAQR